MTSLLNMFSREKNGSHKIPVSMYHELQNVLLTITDIFSRHYCSTDAFDPITVTQ